MRDSLGVGNCQVQLLEALETGTTGVERWRGKDLITDREVVVSFFPLAPTDPTSQVLLRTEAEILSALKPPNFATLLAADVVDGKFVEVGLFLEGASLTEKRPLPLEDVLEFAEDALGGLELLHNQGVLHGYLETDSYLRDSEKFVLNDLGLARRLGWTSAEARALSCSSPEALGLIQRPLTPSSDLYSLGLILRRCLLGPEAAPLALTDRLKTLTDLPGQLPSQLRSVLLRMCAPDPQYRYQSAKGALADFKALRTGKRFALGQFDPRQTLTSPTISGRDEDIAQLRYHLSGASGLVLLLAPSGRGKSVVLRALSDELCSEGTAVFVGQGVAPEKSMPSQPLWQNVLSAIASWLPTSERDRLKAHLSSVERERLVQAFPSWSFLGNPGQEAEVSEATLAEAVTRVLNHLSQSFDIVYLIDDAQWADPLTFRLLERHDRNFQCVVAYRVEEESPRLAALRRQMPNVELEPLSDGESQALLFSMAGPLNPSVFGPIIARAKGEPLWLQSLLRGVVEEQHLVFRAGQWGWKDRLELNPDSQFGEELARRLTNLPGPTLELLRAGSLLGKSFRLNLALEMCGALPDDLTPALDRGLVWREAEQTVFGHDKVREGVYHGLTQEQRSQLHQNAAERLENSGNASPRELAFHWFQGKQPAKAFPYALQAAESAMTSFDYSTAQAMWKIASSALELEPAIPEKAKILIGVARSCYLSGDSAGAIPLYQAALQVVQAPLVRASMIADMVSAMSKLCQFDNLMDWARNGLSGLGVKIPSGSAQVKFAAGKEMARLLLTLQRDRPESIAKHERAAGKLLVWLSEGALRKEQPDLMLWSICTAARRLYCHDAPAEAGLAFGFCSLVFGAVGLTGPREKLNLIAEEYVSKHPEIAGHVRGMSGLKPLQDGDLEEAARKFHLGWEFSRAYADGWNRQVCSLHHSWALLLLGRFEEARIGFHELLEDEDGRDVTIKLVSALGLSISGVDAQLSQSWISKFRENYVGTVFETLLAQLQGQLLVLTSKWGEAVPFLERAAQKYHVKTTVFGAGAAGWLATALRLEVQALPIEAEARRRQLFKKIASALKLGRAHAKAWKIFSPHLLREEALLKCFEGNFAQARSYFEESERIAQSFPMPFEVAWTKYERGRFASVAGWRHWCQDFSEGLAAARRLEGWIPGVELTFSAPDKNFAKIERFDLLLDAGRRLVALDAQTSSPSLLEKEAMALLRCDGAKLVFFGKETPNGVWSEDLFQECCQLKRAVSLSQTQTPFSLLMSPLNVDGQWVATFIAWQDSVHDFFGAEELRLADYLCTLNGAGLENKARLASRDQVKNELQFSEKRFREFFNYAGLGTALLDSDANVLTENAQLRLVLGRSFEGELAWSAFHPFDNFSLKESFSQLTTGTLGHHDQEVRVLCRESDPVQVYLGRLPVSPQYQPVFLMTVSEATHHRVSEFMSTLETDRRSLAALLEGHVGLGLQQLQYLLEEIGTMHKFAPNQALITRLVSSYGELETSLRRPLLAPVDLSAKLCSLIEHFSSESGLDVKVDWAGELPEVPDLIGMTLMRVLQEGLTNIRKHSQATYVELGLATCEDRLRLHLIDNGIGFPVDQQTARRGVKRSFGLLSMKERAQLAGGHVHLTSTPGEGTRLDLELPLHHSSGDRG